LASGTNKTFINNIFKNKKQRLTKYCGKKQVKTH